MNYRFQLAIPLANDEARTARIAGGDGLDDADIVECVRQDQSAGHLRLIEADADVVMFTWCAEWPQPRFFAHFQSTLEWLAKACDYEGFVGTYQATSLPHPTAIYFCDGVPFVLQCCGVPIDMQTGTTMSDDQFQRLAARDGETDEDEEQA